MTAHTTTTAPLSDAEGEQLLRRILLRIVPFIFVC